MTQEEYIRIPSIILFLLLSVLLLLISVISVFSAASPRLKIEASDVNRQVEQTEPQFSTALNSESHTPLPHTVRYLNQKPRATTPRKLLPATRRRVVFPSSDSLLWVLHILMQDRLCASSGFPRMG